MHGVWHSSRIEKLGALFLVIASVFVAVLAIGSFMDLWRATPSMGNVITVDGEGSATIIPDIATISFSVMGEGKTASLAQEEATKKINVALALLKEKGIEEKDIKTTGYSVSPKYSYPQPCYTPPCIYDEQRIVGYQVSQTSEVKVRDTGAVGDILSALGDAGISQLYGPNFTNEDGDAVRAEARKEAIEKARAKAEELADQLDVRLVRVVSFYENTGGYPLPYYAKDAAIGFGGAVESRAVPTVPVGENEVVVNVSITYEIR